MEQTEKQLLVQAIDLIKQGENQQAVKVLAGLLAKQPQLEQAWYLMGVALDDPEKKRFAFEHTLKLNPNNDRAKQQLLKMEDEALPKAPTPIRIEAPPPPPPRKETTPLVSTPWITEEPEEEEHEVELPSWARDITPAAQPTAGETSFEPGASPWEWQDELPDEPRSSRLRPAVDQPAFLTTETVEEPQAEEKPKRKGLFQKEKKESADQEETEEKKKAKRKTRAEKKAEKEAEKQEKADQKKEKTLQEQLLADESKRKFRISWRPRKGLVVFILFLFICGGLGGGAYYYQDNWIPLVTPYVPTVIAFLTQAPTPTPDYTATPTFTPVFQPTMPPTWTPAVTQSGLQIIPTLPPLDITPTITPTPIPVDTSITGEMDTIQEQMFSLRELTRLAEVDREMMPAAKFKTYMEALALSRYDREAVARQQTILRAMGWVANDYYHVEVIMNDLIDFVGGFYYPEQHKIYIPGSGFYALEQFIYSYEYGFALLDENFNVYDQFCQNNVDACLAEAALVVGDVTFTQELWLETYPIQFDPAVYFNLENPDPVFHTYRTPAYFNAYRNFPVRYGYPFLLHLYQTNGWLTVNYTYRFPPQTSEQVMHPEKFDARENPVQLLDPDLLDELGEGWELLERGTLGEWRTSLLLSAPDYPAAVRPEDESLAAAAGWGGDKYQVYSNAETGAVALTAHWNWDTPADVDEFFNSMQASQAGRFQDQEFDGPGEGICWVQNDSEYSCLYRSNRDVLWIYATDLTALETAKSAFGLFQ